MLKNVYKNVLYPFIFKITTVCTVFSSINQFIDLCFFNKTFIFMINYNLEL